MCSSDLEGMLTDRTLAIAAETAAAAGFGASPASVAMAWVARQPGVTAVIAGPRTLSHLHDSLAAFSLTLPPDALARLSDISRPASPVDAQLKFPRPAH